MVTTVIIQARMGSTRLPGKVLMPLAGRSVLAHVIQRAAAARGVDRVVVATSTLPSDDPVAAEAEACGAATFRGSEADVLSRYHGAATEAGADTVVRITSDCPLLDSDLLSDMLEQFHSRRARGEALDYYSNALIRTYPRGLDAEIFTMAALDRAHREARDPAEREHVTLYINHHPDLFTLGDHVGETDHSHLRWTLDTPEDYRLLSAVYDALDRGDGRFTTAEVLDLLAERPELARLNAHIEQKKV